MIPSCAVMAFLLTISFPDGKYANHFLIETLEDAAVSQTNDYDTSVFKCSGDAECGKNMEVDNLCNGGVCKQSDYAIFDCVGAGTKCGEGMEVDHLCNGGVCKQKKIVIMNSRQDGGVHCVKKLYRCVCSKCCHNTRNV